MPSCRPLLGNRQARQRRAMDSSCASGSHGGCPVLLIAGPFPVRNDESKVLVVGPVLQGSSALLRRCTAVCATSRPGTLGKHRLQKALSLLLQVKRMPNPRGSVSHRSPEVPNLRGFRQPQSSQTGHFRRVAQFRRRRLGESHDEAHTGNWRAELASAAGHQRSRQGIPPE